MMTATDTPRVWIGCLASYNAGRLIGEWVDAIDLDEMNECRDRVAVQAVEAAKAAGEYPVYFGDPEEFFLADNEGFGFNPGEYPNWEALAQVGALIDERGEDFRRFLEWIDDDPLTIADDLEDRFSEAYCGEWDSEEDYAADYVDSCWNVPEELESYIDYEKVAQELFDHGPYTLSGGIVWRSE